MATEYIDNAAQIIDSVAEKYWPSDPDRDGPEAKGLHDFYRIAEQVVEPNELYVQRLEELAASLPNTRRVR